VAAIWIVSEESALPATLAHHVETLGEVWLGVPERAAFKSAPAPDLLILCGVTEIGSGHDALERLLAFVRQIPQQRRAAAPVLYLASDAEPSRAARIERLFDDRVCSVFGFPLDPDELEARSRELVDANRWPASLRERTRSQWVTHEVERLYAGIDLPALRQAVDPRNAHRPVLLIGESGTRRGLLARYVHNLAEPVRDVFAAIALPAIAPGELERAIMTRCGRGRATVYIEGLDRAAPALQAELAQLLGASGALAIEPLRWIASATRGAGLDRALRELAWLRVELPPLRARDDKAALLGAAFRAAAERQGRELVLEPAAAELLSLYGWPGNLRELEQVADASCAAAAGARIGAADLRIAGRAPRPMTPELTPAQTPGAAPQSEPEPAPLADPVPAPSPVPTLGVQTELSDEDLMLATLAPSDPSDADAPAEFSLELDEADLIDLDEPETPHEPEPELLSRFAPPATEPIPASLTTSAPTGLSPRELVIPLAQAIRAPLRAFRTYASLVEQRPDDPHVRRELRTLVEHDLGGLEDTLQRVERFARLTAPVPRPFDLAAALGAELDARQSEARAKSLVVLRELDALAPPLVADEAQVRLAVRALLDLALRLVPQGGDLYLGSAWRPKGEGRTPGHRLLLRFHSPEDVLTGPAGDADSDLLEVVIAREIFVRAGGSFAIDASGAQDNVILVELPG
jgi:DNA-binding NtrC family response regulator